MTGNKVLVTGGAGFIGSHLVELLILNGYEVTVLDNLSTGRIDNLRHIMKHDNVVVGHVDVSDRNALHSYFEGIQCVFHLAALADIVPSIRDPLDYHKSNVDGTISVLEASRAAGVKRFIYAASSSCYGIPDVFPTAESASIKPMYPYALTKNIGEQYVLHWESLYDLSANSLRLFNVYGPRSRTTGSYGAVFGVFLAQKIAGRPFTVVGDGNQTRDFVYVTDVAKAFMKAAESDFSGEVFNIGSGDPKSINYLISLLGGDAIHIPKRPGEPDITFADNSKARELLGWGPIVSFEEGVANMLEQSDHWKDAPVWDADSIEEATKDWFNYLGAQK